MLSGSYNYGLVALSVLIGMSASYVAIDLTGRTTDAQGRTRLWWLVGGALAMGIGVWSMHNIGMLAFTLPVPVLYDVPTVLLSLLAAILASGVALFVVSRQRLALWIAAVGSVLMGGGVSEMHYIGMSAMRLPAVRQWNMPLVGLSIGIAIGVSLIALWLAFQSRSETRTLAPLKLVSGAVMGVAVAAMHYTGMAAVTFVRAPVGDDLTHAVSISSLGIAGITLVTSMVLALAILTAVMDRRLAAHAVALQSSEERYRLLFNRSLAGVYQSTLDGRLLDCNDAFAGILGFSSRADCLRSAVADFYLGDEERERFVSRLKQQNTLPDFESCLRRSDGSTVWVLENATLSEGTPTHPALIEGTLVDITRRKQVEQEVASKTQELTASVERYRVLIESTQAVPWEVDATTFVLSYVSPQAVRLFEREPDQLINQISLLDLVHPDDRDQVREQFSGLARSTAVKDLDLDYRVLTARNRVVYVHSVVSATRPAEGRVVLRGITLDVTKQTKLEVDLRQAQKLESVGRLAAGVAHEINTPVQFISDSLHFVRDAMNDVASLLHRYRALGDAVREGRGAQVAVEIAEAADELDMDYLIENVPKALDRSLEGLSRVATIVRSMKEFAHPDQKEMTAIDLNRAIDSTLVIARNEYKYVAEVTTDFGDIPQVTCHAGDVNQVILNIIVNAAHAIESVVAGTDRKGDITLRTRCDGDAVIVSIADTGAGIPEAIRAQIFDPFFTTKEVGKGTGQGLAIARSVILEKHGGDLTFESEVGKGTTFFVRLPVAGRPRVGVAA